MKGIIEIVIKDTAEPCVYVTSLFIENHILPSVIIYNEIQEKRSMFWEVVVSVIERNNMNTCLTLNAYRDGAV